MQVGVDGECERTVTKMLFCPYCRGLLSAKPCPTYCNEVMTSCLAGHASSAQFAEAWNDYIGQCCWYNLNPARSVINSLNINGVVAWQFLMLKTHGIVNLMTRDLQLNVGPIQQRHLK